MSATATPTPAPSTIPPALRAAALAAAHDGLDVHAVGWLEALVDRALGAALAAPHTPAPHPPTPTTPEMGWLVWGRKKKGGKRHLVLSATSGLFPARYREDARFLAAMRAHGLTEWEMIQTTTQQHEWKYLVPLVLVETTPAVDDVATGPKDATAAHATTPVDWPCLHGTSTRHGPLHCLTALPGGRYAATMGDGATLPGVASTFDADDVAVGAPQACPSVTECHDDA